MYVLPVCSLELMEVVKPHVSGQRVTAAEKLTNHRRIEQRPFALELGQLFFIYTLLLSMESAFTHSRHSHRCSVHSPLHPLCDLADKTPQMEILLSAFFAEAITRSIDFFISKCSMLHQAQDMEDRFHRALLRAQVIIHEATGRQVTNYAMLQQLDMLRDAVHRGWYRLDTFRCQSHDDEEDANNQGTSHSLSLSKLRSLKRNTLSLEQLQEALASLSSIMLDVQELVGFLTSYPCMYRQPYSMHLQLRNCMFSRQMETELVISFLLHTPHSAGELEVLPIIGPGKVGKSTLIACVSNDERIREHFSEILFIHYHDFTNDDLAKPREGCQIVRHQNHVSNKDEKLVVVKLTSDLNEDAWNRLQYSCKQYMPKGGKMIITSKSDKITKFGATQALTLKHLSQEEYWYFFKTMAFGSIDPEMHPSLMHIAMEIARTLDSSFIGANVTSSVLRENFDIQFWRKVLSFLRWSFQRHVSKFGNHPCHVLNHSRSAHFGRMVRTSEEVIVHHQYQCSSEEEIPKIRIQDVIYGSLRPHGKFEALLWSSTIPPYFRYNFLCETQEVTAAVKRKRS